MLTLITLAAMTGHGLATKASCGKTAWPIKRAAGRDTTDLPAILSLPLSSYIGKPVDSFFKKLPAGYSQLKVMSKDGSRYARYLLVKYDSIRVLIFVKEFHHLTPKNHNMNWDINLFKMENVACIEIWNRRRRITPECRWWE